MSEEITPEIAQQWLRGDQPLNVAPAIVRAYLEKCEQEKEDIASFKACMRQDFKEKSQLRNENKKLMAQLDVAASHLTHTINNNAAIREEIARLQDIVEKQRSALEACKDFTKRLDSLINNELRVLGKHGCSMGVKAWLDHKGFAEAKEALSLTATDKETE